MDTERLCWQSEGGFCCAPSPDVAAGQRSALQLEEVWDGVGESEEEDADEQGDDEEHKEEEGEEEEEKASETLLQEL